ncbi:hypothetical protein ACFOTA_00140 [Chitinophaga sp. GCM10012297]|uniref:Uncharacterized protein n=1 Tax=Chitinophaga chungangae TaxID=2821488 RepID=A0ABS3Y7F0_9BACT|nr:hypothetical protein [Chitinophaga chungangae]MBO9150598.1 hypothetical protein [Chitinophaga chungangae]
MHSSELDELILIYEAEQAHLESLIKDALEESDYFFAATVKKGLLHVKQMLASLRHFQDPDLQEKQWLEGWVKLYTGLSEEWRSGYHPNPEIEQFKAKLESLQEKPAGVTPNENELTDALYDLIERKNAGFRLHLRREQDFFIEFRLVDPSAMRIAFPVRLNYGRDWGLPMNRDAVLRLGFGPAEGEIMALMQPLGEPGAVAAIKRLLARLLFENIFYIQYDNPATIEFL